jgi:AmmeMemoRadiSam system protein B
MIRRPAVAGSFYPGSKTALEKELAEYIEISENKKKVLGLISPHAGYIYSGNCAGKGFGLVEIPGTVIILGVNHRSMGHPFAVDGNDYWNTPLGDVALDEKLRAKIVENSKIFAVDSNAGRDEHSLEVQVPFIQYLSPGTKILPITVSSWDLRDLTLAGKKLGEIVKENRDLLLLASTDMSHFLDAGTAKIQDNKAIEKIKVLDPKGLFETVVEEDISMCGMAPTVIMLNAALEAGAKSVETLCYTNSGEVSGDYNRVVAYYSAIVY